VKVSWSDVLAWRMRRQYLVPRTQRTASEIVGRLGGVQAQVWSAAALAVALRQSVPDKDAVDRSFSEASLMKTWAMRGTLHLLRPDDAPAYLALVETTRVWLKPSWQRVSGVTPTQIDALTEKVATLLDGAVLTREQLVAQIVADKRFSGLEERLRSGWGQVLKPLAWRGVLCHGPNQGNKVTFTLPATRFPTWGKMPDAEQAAPAVIAAYLGAYGPATPEVFDRWLTLNTTSRPRLRQWFGDMGDRLTEVDVEGHRALMLTEHVAELADVAKHHDLRQVARGEEVLPLAVDEADLAAPGGVEDRAVEQRLERAVLGGMLVVNEADVHVVPHSSIKRKPWSDLPVVLEIQGKLPGAFTQIEAGVTARQNHIGYDSERIKMGLCAFVRICIKQCRIDHESQP